MPCFDGVRSFTIENGTHEKYTNERYAKNPNDKYIFNLNKYINSLIGKNGMIKPRIKLKHDNTTSNNIIVGIRNFQEHINKTYAI